jgi:hypothetical protein
MGVIVGQAGEVKEALQRLAEAGVERVMLQWLEQDAVSRLEAFAREVGTTL